MVFATRDLAIYAAVIGTLDGTWSVYQGAILDRARVRLGVIESEIIPAGQGHRIPVLTVTINNRGRRPVEISHMSRVVSVWRSRHELSADILRQLVPKPVLEEGRSATFVHGAAGGYAHGTIPLKRWYVLDGAGRIHPLRERYRQRAERALLWLPRKAVAALPRLF